MPNFRILSCDGGGIRGVLSAVLLNRLSAAYPNLLQDRPDTISMYAGTSTGGILALGLAAGLTPAQIRDLYVTDGKLIFDSSWTRDVVELGGLSGSKYDNVNLKQILQETFGARKLQDLKPRVLIASFSLDNQASDPASRTWNPKFFHNFTGPDSDGDSLLVDVAMSTSAAPTYFPSYGVYIDGGVIANNPSMAAVVQAMDGRNQPGERATLDGIKLLSIGTGASLQYIDDVDHDWGDAQWIKPILNVMMDGSVGVADFECRQLLGNSYCRVEPIFPAGKSFAMDDVSKAVDLMDQANSFDLASTVAWLNASGW
ncbi:MAG: patatin-like phospholipase family protein [Candidatus Binatus sp.]|jgi:patatin-like phospholipase/acyl hydrolase|uniref:patatin-like phospholipase family protein n=1 Tax=Candidatus Binatus sp. TaxID=2811406 RepID=UPI003C75B069